MKEVKATRLGYNSFLNLPVKSLSKLVEGEWFLFITKDNTLSTIPYRVINLNRYIDSLGKEGYNNTGELVVPVDVGYICTPKLDEK